MAIRKTRRQLVMDAGSIAAIYAAGWGQPAPVAVAAPVPQPAPTVNALMRSYVDTLADDLSPDAGHRCDAASLLHFEFSLASVWSDLCEQAGEPVPADVEAALSAPALASSAPLFEKSAAREHAEYLLTLIGEWERKAAGAGTDAARAISLLANVDRCLDLPTDCLDGSFMRRINAA